jgi:lactose/L-arabinose transport system ATP-binding protein
MDGPVRSALEPGKMLQVGVRPEHLDHTDGISLEAQVEFVEVLGSTSYVNATLATGETIIAERRSCHPRTGDKISVQFVPVSVRLFGEDGARVR